MYLKLTNNYIQQDFKQFKTALLKFKLNTWKLLGQTFQLWQKNTNVGF